MHVQGIARNAPDLPAGLASVAVFYQPPFTCTLPLIAPHVGSVYYAELAVFPKLLLQSLDVFSDRQKRLFLRYG